MRQLPTFTPSKETQNILNSGVIYQLGRDKEYRPLVIIALSKLRNFRESEEALIEALKYILCLVRVKMLLPYFVERWSLLIDTNDVSVLKNIEEFLEKIYSVVRDHFPESVHKIYLLNVNIMGDIGEKWNRKLLSRFLLN